MMDMPDGAVDMAFADPPFNIGYDYDVYDDTRGRDEYLKWSRQWMTQIHRVLKPNGTFWLSIGDEFAAELKVEAQNLGFHCRSWVVWYYTFGVHCKNKFTRSHAHLFHFVKNPKEFTFNNRSVRVPSARQLVYNDARANPIGRMPDDTWILRPQDLIDGFDPDDDVWYFPRVAGTFKERAGFHGCQMPEQLLGRIIRSCSNEGDVVLDPFSGSATTLAVAKKLGRSWIGFELSEDYVAMGTDRLGAIQTGDVLDGSEEPQVSAPTTASRARRKKKDQAAAPFSSGKLDFEGLKATGQAIVEAFQKTNDGFSVDRLVADPTLNEAFQSACEQLGTSGTAAERNRALFGLRKSGKLARAGITTNRRTNINWQKASRYIFASEIAWRQITDKCNLSLDEILCDPELAAKFDKIAMKFAPEFSPLEYRWGALKLRKAAGIARRCASPRLPRFESSVSLDDLRRDWHILPSEPGVYAVLDSQEKYLYTSETINLRERLRRHFRPKGTSKQWEVFASEIHVSHLPIRYEGRLALQSRLVIRHKPELNIVSQLAG
jgi:site-specific DNA-methyltransferase (adenine-specific)